MVAVDWRSDRQGVDRFYRENGWELPTLFDTEGVSTSTYGIVMTPTTMVIGPDGRILWRHVGYRAGDEAVLRRKALEVLEGAG